MLIDRLLGRKPARSAGRRLHDAAAAQARAPALYARLGAPDTTDGRFELLTAHVLLLVDRLKGEGPEAAQASQALFDTYVGDLDGALREMGVGDLAVPKRMKAVGQAFYGRATVLKAAYAALPDAVPLRDAIRRTLLQGADSDPAPLAAYLIAARAALAAQPTAAIVAGDVAWPTP